MYPQLAENNKNHVKQGVNVKEYADRLVASMGYNDAICTAIEFQLFNVAEELRFMQDEFRGDL